MFILGGDIVHKVKILHTADLHIGAEMSYLGTNAESRRYENLSVFKSITEYCTENNVEICLIAGDLFDSNSAAIPFADSVFEYISLAPSTHFFYVAGNHDPLDSSSVFEGRTLPSNLTVFGEDFEIKEIPELKVRVMGKSFKHSFMAVENFNKVLPLDDFVNLFVLHADFESDSSSPYNPITREFIEGCSADYLALGHIHKRSNIAKIGNTYTAYCGSPEGHGFDELGVKGAYVGEVSKESVDLSFVKFSKRVYCLEEIDISSAFSPQSATEIIINKLKSSYGEAFRENLYKIVLKGRCENYKNLKSSEILSLLKSELYFVKIKNELKPDYDLEALKNEISLKGLFVKNLLNKIQAEPENESLMDALYLGLEAFEGEVAYNED